MADVPNKKKAGEASGQGASLSGSSSSRPSAAASGVRATPDGKTVVAKRPSMAGAKRVQKAAVREDAPVAPDEFEEVSLAEKGGMQLPEPEGDARPSVEDYARDSAADVRNRANAKQGGAHARGKKHKKKKGLGVGVIALIVVVCLLVAAIAGLSVTRWTLPNDAADIQGTWHTEDSQNAIVITDSEIDLAQEASYQYTMDSFAKTLDASFFSMEGKAHYRFSRDRQSVAVIECSSYDWLAMWEIDLKWAWEDFTAMLEGNPYDPLGQDSGITLVRA